MIRYTFSRLLNTLVSGSILLFAAPAIAGPIGDGQYAFDRAPRVIRLTSSLSQTHQPGDTYRLVITVPEDAGAPLQAIRITQRNDQEAIVFQSNETRIFADNSATEIPQMSIGGTENASELLVVLHHPVQPGQTVTFHLKPEQNPSQDGIYLLGVTAYPSGKNSPGLFLGYSRLTFHAPSGR
ncbi:MAG: DUF2808 domain-containing protein [Leptolyngbyaceae cyanobacterium bins.59]|nr:DUF2808 domain-containing protein [Leptolyngbyaceae cyanobacterium bins.59]